MVRVVRPSIYEQNLIIEVSRRCHRLLVKLMEHQHGWVFNVPVDVKGLRAVGYYDVVKNPMDLGTVKCRLENRRYSSPIEFAEDVQLTFDNAMKYNNQGDAVYTMAKELLEIFTLEWSNIEADFAPLFNNIKMFKNPSAGATSGSVSNEVKEKGKEIARARELSLTDEKYGSWREIFSEELLLTTEDEVQAEHPELFPESSAKADETEVQQLKDMLAATQEKLRETEEKLQDKESMNERLRRTIERLEQESPSSWNDFWDTFVQRFNDPRSWPLA